MQDLILNELDLALEQVNTALNNFEDITLYQEIFEASEPDIADKMRNNIIQKESANSGIMKAVSAIKKFIQNIIDSITNFIREVTMSKDEKDKFKKFKESCAKDPTLKNKKITVKTYRESMKKYDEVLKNIEAKMEEVKRNEKTPIEEIVSSTTKFLSTNISAVGTILTADAAMKAAESNIEMARDLSLKLNNDQKYMDQLTKELGAKEAEKYKKKVEGLSKFISLERLKAKVFAKKYNNMQECISSTISQLEGLASDNIIVQAKTAAANPTMAKRLLTNQNFKPTLNAFSDAKKEARKNIRKEKIRQTLLGDNYRKGKGVYKSKNSFLFGNSKKS